MLNYGRLSKGRGRGRGWGIGSTYRQLNHNDPLLQRPPSPPVGALLQRVTHSDILAAVQIQRENGEMADITSCKYVASFNWLDKDEPTILIPGSPPAWTPADTPYSLPEDKGNYFRDPNAARFQTHPLEPAVRTLLIDQDEIGDLDTQDIDLFACSSTVGNLLRFVRRIEMPFRFFVEVVGNTVFFERHENSPTELIKGVHGYGHTFPEAYTTWDPDVRDSASHQRLLRYNFAGLDCIVRFECDGYLRSKVPENSAVSVRDLSLAPEGDDKLASLLGSANILSSLGAGKERDNVLKVESAGRKITQDAVFDLKTRSIRKKDLNVLEDELPRYWVAQIPNFILARHDKGVFNDIQVHHIWDDVKKWERQNQIHTRTLRWLLREIITAAKGSRDRKLEVCCKSVEALELREQDLNQHDVLPVELKLQWINGDRPGETASQSEEESEGGAPLLSASANDDSTADDGIVADYTACSEGCGYCGCCSY